MSWWDKTFQEKLFIAHNITLFPENRDKNNIEFLSMTIEKLIDKVDGMNDEEINKLFEKN